MGVAQGLRQWLFLKVVRPHAPSPPGLQTSWTRTPTPCRASAGQGRPGQACVKAGFIMTDLPQGLLWQGWKRPSLQSSGASWSVTHSPGTACKPCSCNVLSEQEDVCMPWMLACQAWPESAGHCQQAHGASLLTCTQLRSPTEWVAGRLSGAGSPPTCHGPGHTWQKTFTDPLVA